MTTLFPQRQQLRKQRGQALIIFALGLTFLIGIAGIAIEGGLLEGDRRFDQAISDGAALAGAHHLSASPTAAQVTAAKKAAVDYVVAGLNGGTAPLSCDASGLYAAGGTLSTQCDPTPVHTVSFTTPYPDASHPDQILVHVGHAFNVNLMAVVGITNTGTGSRSVARSFSGPGPFNYTVYASGDLTTVGNTTTAVEGNVYVTGCIQYNNMDFLDVSPSGGQAGTVEVYNKNNTGPNGGQVWTSGSGSGCTANVTANHAPGQWGATGHTAGFENCGVAPGNFTANCPSSEQPVPLVPVPGFNITDQSAAGSKPCDAAGAIRLDFLTQGMSGLVASPGCYSACALGGGNVNIPTNTSFLPGTYAFFGNGTTGCDVIFTGTASNSGGPTNGVTFILYNGTSMCASTCGNSSGSGTLTFNAPTTGPNAGVLVYSCNSIPCGGGSGNFNVKGPGWSTNFTGLIYNPGGDCTVVSNSGEQITGQLICHNVSLQGGSISAGTGVTFGGSGVPTPQFLAQLIE
jgi:hypothetical protein